MATKARGSSFFTEFMVKGQRYRATVSSHDEGERWELDVRHALKTGRPVPPAPSEGRVSGGAISTFRQVADYAIKNHWTDTKPDYLVVVERYANEMADYFGGNIPMASIKRRDIDGYIRHLQKKGNSHATVNRKMSALSGFFKVAKSLDVVDGRPSWPKRLKEAREKVRFVYEHEERVLLKTAVQFDDWELHDLMVFALDTGARWSEIIKARWDWFTPGYASWIIWDRKADNPFAMPLTERARKVIERRSSNQGGPFKGITYDSVRHRLQRLLGTLELEDITFHTFRHTTASRLVQRGVDLRRVQVWMGHKTIATTIRYAHLATNDLMDVVKVLEPANDTAKDLEAA